MKQIRKQLAALLLAVALVAACAAPAFAAATAASIELTRKGSITVTLRDSESGSAVSGGKLTLYQVASISRQNGNLSYDYTNGFENCGVSLGDLSESDLARTLDDKRPADSKGETLTVDTDGKAGAGGVAAAQQFLPAADVMLKFWFGLFAKQGSVLLVRKVEHRWWRRTRTSTMWTPCPRWAR